MEWFRRPDGSVAVSEVAARPPGAQLTSMHGYAHDIDFYRAWAELVVLGTVRRRRSGGIAAGTAYLRGRAAAGSRAVHGIEEVQAADRAPGRGGASCRSRASRRPRLQGEGYVIVRDPDTEVVRGRAAAHRQPGSAWSWLEAR